MGNWPQYSNKSELEDKFQVKSCVPERVYAY